MTFYIETENGTGSMYRDRYEFLDELLRMIDDCYTNGGTEFDVTVFSDASCYCEIGDDEDDDICV